MLETKDLMLVQALARTKNVRRAAELMRVHQSTLFRQLDALEQDLGVRLFVRLREGYALTPAGERMCDLAQRTQQELDDLERHLRSQDMRPSGTVRVTTTDTLVMTHLTPILARFRNVCPEIELEVNVSNQFLALTKREADVAIRPTFQAPENLVGKSLCTLAVAIYASKQYVAQHAPTTASKEAAGELDDLAQHAWIGPDESLQHVRWIRDLRKNYPDLAMPYRINSVYGMMQAAKAGMGLVMLPCYVGDSEPELLRLRAPTLEQGNKLWLLTHPDMRQVARVRAFFDFVGAELGKLRPLFEGRADVAASKGGGRARFAA
jgi:DNA-binding transcriptional LysR family regulator